MEGFVPVFLDDAGLSASLSRDRHFAVLFAFCTKLLWGSPGPCRTRFKLFHTKLKARSDLFKTAFTCGRCSTLANKWCKMKLFLTHSNTYTEGEIHLHWGKNLSIMCYMKKKLVIVTFICEWTRCVLLFILDLWSNYSILLLPKTKFISPFWS